MDIADALMSLTNDELIEVEVTQEDGTLTRPYRENIPVFRTNKDGMPSF